MKIYNNEPTHVQRICIKRQGNSTQYLNIVDTNQDECFNFLLNLIKTQNLSPIINGNRTNIQVRDAIGSKNLIGKSFSFFGLDPIQVKELIIKNIEK
jgi:hypothetical protein